MTWRVARSLETFIHECNTAWPHRSKSADGTIGDTSHASRLSGHNPNAAGVVRAFDLTHDPTGGPDCNIVAEQLRTHALGRFVYLIWNRRIVDGRGGTSPGQWRDYTGADPHTGHIHLSVGTDTYPYKGTGGSAALYDNAAAWPLPCFGDDDMAMTPAERAAFIKDIAAEVNHTIRGSENFSPSGNPKGPFTYFDSIIRGISQGVAAAGPVLVRIEKKIDQLIAAANK